MNTTIYVRVREVYGKTTLYPACKTAVLLTELAGQKTFTPTTLHLVRQLGYTVKEAARLDADHFAR